jgi:hypothetical protein
MTTPALSIVEARVALEQEAAFEKSDLPNVIQYGKSRFDKQDHGSIVSYTYGNCTLSVFVTESHVEIIAYDEKMREVRLKEKRSEMTKTKFIKMFIYILKKYEGQFNNIKERIFGPKPVVTSRVALEDSSLDLVDSNHVVGEGIELRKTSDKESSNMLEFDLIVKSYRFKFTYVASSNYAQVSRNYNAKVINIDPTDRIGSLRAIKSSALELVQQEKRHNNRIETIKTVWNEKLDREYAKELVVDGVKFVRDARLLKKPSFNADQEELHNLMQNNLVKYVATINNVKYPVYWHTAKETVKMCTVKLDEQGKVKERRSGSYNQTQSTIGQSVTILKGVEGYYSPIDILRAAVKVLKRRKVL